MSHYSQKIVKFLDSAWPGTIAWTIGICALMMVARYATNGQTGSDALYHITHASEIARAHDWTLVRPWIVQHFFSTNPANPYILAHTLLAMLMSVFPPTFAATLWTAGQAGVVAGVVYYILHAYRVKHASLWTLLAMGTSAALMYRLLLARPFVLGMACFVLGIHFIHARYYRRLFVLATIYLLYYNFAIMLGAYAVLAVAVAYWYDRRLELKPIIATFGGFLLALLIHPHTLAYITLIYTHAITIPWLLFSGAPMLRGAEIVPQETTSLVIQTIIPSLMAIIAIMLVLARERDRSYSMMTTIAVWCILWIPITTAMPRPVEYWVLPAWILSAILIRTTPIAWPAKITMHRHKLRWILYLATIVIVTMNATSMWKQLNSKAHKQIVADAKTVAETLTEVSPAGSIVYMPDWSIFPKLFAHNRHNRYLTGFDPVFQYQYSPEMYWLWHNLSFSATACAHEPPCEREPTDAELYLHFDNTFDTPYIVVPNSYAEAFRQRIEIMPRATMILETETFKLFELDR